MASSANSLRFQWTDVALTAPGLHPGGPPLRFALLSDLHVRRPSPEHDRLVCGLNARRLDFIFLAGDYVGGREGNWDALSQLLSRLRCRHGVYACRGNREVKYDAPRLAQLRELFSAAGARLLVNESVMVEAASGNVRVAGVDDLVRGWPDFRATVRGADGADYSVLLAHAPLAARLLPAEAEVDLVLSGHTHGGQIRLPGLWRLMLPRCCGRLTDGFYEVDGRQLYVSRGFGTVGLVRARFRCPAEVTVFEAAPG
jgi:predicted MPP superfamily phosphohydrolase